MAKFVLLFCICVAWICVCDCISQGTWDVQDTSKIEVKQLGKLAISKINQKDKYFSRLQRVTNAKKKIVRANIFKWKLSLIREKTDCIHNAVTTNWAKCQITEKDECKVLIIVGPEMNEKEVKVTECHPLKAAQKPGYVKKAQQPLVGGISSPSNVDDDDKQAAVDFAVKSYNARSNGMFMQRPISVKVSTQVVAGALYRIDMQLGDTACRKNSKNAKQLYKGCELTNSNMVTHCYFAVWYKAWEKKKPFTLITEGPDKFKCTSRFKSSTKKMKREVYMYKRQNVDSVMDKGGLHYKKHQSMLGGDGHDTDHQQVMEDYAMFKTFLKKYNKHYADKNEHYRRFDIFRFNMKKVEEIQKMDKGSARYGATKFADLTEAEFRKNYLTPKWNQAFDPRLSPAVVPQTKPPASFDWRDHNAVTVVKNQGSCGSCWAFSTTGNIEGQWAIKKKNLVSLSEQELVDCDKLDQGCGGGLPSNAYQAIMKLGGLETEKEYPYEGEGEKCAFIKRDVKVYINSSLNISSNEADMAAWLAENGPISIGINAFAMQFYFGGISHPWSIFCNPEELDHGVLIVGYGTKAGEPYWIIKNSWGSDWGEDGYYLVYRGSGVCGLNRMCTSAKVD